MRIKFEAENEEEAAILKMCESIADEDLMSVTNRVFKLTRRKYGSTASIRAILNTLVAKQLNFQSLVDRSFLVCTLSPRKEIPDDQEDETFRAIILDEDDD